MTTWCNHWLFSLCFLEHLSNALLNLLKIEKWSWLHDLYDIKDIDFYVSMFRNSARASED